MLVSAAIRDITVQKLAKNELIRKNQLLSYAEKITMMGNWQWNIITNSVKWSNNLYKIFGLDEKHTDLTYETYSNFVHPDDKEFHNQLVEQRIKTKDDKPFEYRVLCKDETIKYVMVQMEVVDNDQGEAIFFQGTVIDITERKKFEEEREKLIKELQEALKEIKTLRGILPLCSFCKKIRDDKGYWEQVDVYIHKHSQAEISHGICPDCVKEHYPDLDI